MVTGGLGFIGSNLVNRLVELGASVSIVDSSISGCGANPYNIAAVRDRVRLIPLDIADAADFADEIHDCSLVFNLAGEISHTHSMQFPERDMEINTRAQLRFLEVCRRMRPGIRVVYASTRQVYGRPQYLPVDEMHPLQPIDFNGIHKLAAAQYHLLLSNRGEIDATILRLTNIYGPRMALDLPWQGVIGTFVRKALLGETLQVFGDGQYLRDPLFVDDVVAAFVLAGAAGRLPFRIYNVGGAKPLTLAAMAEGFARAGGHSAVCYTPFPEHRQAIDIGSFSTDWSRIRRDLGWQPSVTFEDGARRTLEYYRRHLGNYLAPPAAGRPRAAEAQAGRG